MDQSTIEIIRGACIASTILGTLGVLDMTARREEANRGYSHCREAFYDHEDLHFALASHEEDYHKAGVVRARALAMTVLGIVGFFVSNANLDKEQEAVKQEVKQEAPAKLADRQTKASEGVTVVSQRPSPYVAFNLRAPYVRA